MDLRKPLFTALALVALAAPTAVTVEARESAPAARFNQAPVAVITQTHAKPMIVNGYEVMRYSLSGTSSYDPDGSIASYYWSSSCIYIANGYNSTYTIDVRAGDTCEVNLYVTDNAGATGRDTEWFQGP